MLQSMGSQRVGHNLVHELILLNILPSYFFFSFFTILLFKLKILKTHKIQSHFVKKM